MNKTASFAWRVLGALAPQVMRMFALVAAGQPLPPIQWNLYTPLFLAYALCGGFLAIAWRPENELKAIWVGASLPALIASLSAPPAH